MTISRVNFLTFNLMENYSMKSYRSYLTFINNEIHYNVQFIKTYQKSSKSKHRLCYVFSEHGYSKCRNILFNNYLRNYFCLLPEDVSKKYSFIQNINDWCQWNNESPFINLHSYNIPSQNDFDILVKKYPDFYYTLVKYCKSVFKNYNHYPPLIDCFNLLLLWKNNPQCEFVIMSDYLNILFNKSFYKMTQKNQKDTIKFLYQYNSLIPHNATLFQILKIKNSLNIGLQINEIKVYFDFLQFHREFSDLNHFHYFIKQSKYLSLNIHSVVSLYKDYITLAKALNKDLDNSYHLYPKDLQKRHDKLHLQKKNIDELKALKDSQKRQKEQKLALLKKQNDYQKIVRKYQKFNIDNFQGYKIYVPSSIDDIAKQAQLLNQCLITCDYPSQVINKYCILIFIRDLNNNPLATAQLKNDGQIGQFYANESDRNNCTPSPQIQNVFNNWLKTSKIKFYA